MISSWLARFLPSPRRPISNSRRRRGLSLERLEDRCMPAARFDIATGELFIQGNDSANVVHQWLSDDGFLELSIDGRRVSSDSRSSYFDSDLAGASKATIRQVRFDGGAGWDRLLVGDGAWESSLSVRADDEVGLVGLVTVAEDLRVVAQQVHVEGTISGHQVGLFGQELVEVVSSGTIVSPAGVIILQSQSDSGTVSVSGLLDAAGRRAAQIGGTVQVLGSRVGLFGDARIDVSGTAGGGTALVGGDFQGQGNVQTAAYTFVSAGSSIAADAESGAGGRVVVWSVTERFKCSHPWALQNQPATKGAV